MNQFCALVITTIAGSDNPVLRMIAEGSHSAGIKTIVIGDQKSPPGFVLDHCDYFDVTRQKKLPFRLASSLPYSRYSRKNLGYLLAIMQGVSFIIETDDDNIPCDHFWKNREETRKAFYLEEAGCVNIYRYFSSENIWPRGFPLEDIKEPTPEISGDAVDVHCPIQQGLADDNPDVDGMYRLTSRLPVTFDHHAPIALGKNSWCPFNSQNTTWFREAFALMYLPSFCNFRMTDIWRSFIAQRIAWENNWSVLFNAATVRQERNVHNLLQNFEDEIPGYLNNKMICKELNKLSLIPGPSNIPENMVRCYEAFISKGLIDAGELVLLNDWLTDYSNLISK